MKDWMGVTKLKLNPDKTKVSVLGPYCLYGHRCSLILDGVALPSLLLNKQLVAVFRSAFYQICLVGQLQPYLAKKDLATVTHALVPTRLDNCNALYVGLPLETSQKLKLVQTFCTAVDASQ